MPQMPAALGYALARPVGPAQALVDPEGPALAFHPPDRMRSLSVALAPFVHACVCVWET